MRTSVLVTMLAGLTIVAAVTTSCTGGSGDGSSTSDTTAAPPAVATMDDQARAVPVDGNAFVPLSWTLPEGVNGDDPVVDVARRTTALLLLTELAPDWDDLGKNQALARALTDSSDQSISPTRMAERIGSGKDGIDYPIRLLVQPPRIDGATAVVFVCMDASAAAPGDLASEPVPGSGSGIVRLELRAEDGYWRTTSYNQNTSQWTKEDYQICQDF